MHLDPKQQREKLEAAYRLLMEDLTTYDKFEKIRTLIKGFHPKIDASLAAASDALKHLKKFHHGEIIELTAVGLPEHTEEQKKRKKYLLLFLSTWKNLSNEVKRVQELYAAEQTGGEMTATQHVSALGKIFSLAKGPFGLVTAAAVVIVGGGALLQMSAVSIDIQNSGCAPLTPTVKMPLSIPGLKLPENSIADGGTATAVVPPLSATVDGTQPGFVTISALSFTMEYALQDSSMDIIYDGNSLLGIRQTINLGDSKTHELIVQCR